MVIFRLIFGLLTTVFFLGFLCRGISEGSQVQSDLYDSEGQVLCSEEDLLTLGKSMEYISLQYTSCLNGPKLDQYLKFNFTINLWAVCASQPFLHQPQIYDQTYCRWS